MGAAEVATTATAAAAVTTAATAAEITVAVVEDCSQGFIRIGRGLEEIWRIYVEIVTSVRCLEQLIVFPDQYTADMGL